MKISELVGFLGTAIALLIAAVIRAFSLWSFLGNMTVPWFCAAVAVALLLVLMTAVLSGSSPRNIPMGYALVVIIGTSVILFLGMVIDAIAYHASARLLPVSAAEWLAFTIILAAIFWMPRIIRIPAGEQH